jgi:hypothetical protein
MEAFGREAGISDNLARAAAADDSAIAMDSTFGPPVHHRVYVAMLQGDTATVRRLRPLLLIAVTDSARSLMMDWMLARSLHDTARLPGLLDRFALASSSKANLMLWAVFYGISSLDEAERAVQVRFIEQKNAPDRRRRFLGGTGNIAALKGQPRRAIAFWWDSLDSHDRPYYKFVELGLIGPGYDAVAETAVKTMEDSISKTDKVSLAADLCYINLWRAMHGDTVGPRRAAAHIRGLASNMTSAPAWNVGQLGVCPALLEAAASRRSNAKRRSETLDRVEGLVLRGIVTDMPGNLSHLLIARWLAEDGKYEGARTILRRMDPMSYLLPGPESWRMIGILSTKLGDTTSAIDAYQRFLNLRKDAEPGPYGDQVREARAELTRLGGKEVERYHVFRN